MIQISTSISVRLPDDLARDLENLSETLDRSKGYLIKKAIENYMEEYSDYLIAIERLNDKDDRVISGEEMRELLGSQD